MFRKPVFAVFLLFILSAAAGQARDAVYLKDGSIIKGNIVEYVPDSRLKIRMTDGTILSYEMKEVTQIVKEDNEPSTNNGQSVTNAQAAKRQFHHVILVDPFNLVYQMATTSMYSINLEYQLSIADNISLYICPNTMFGSPKYIWNTYYYAGFSYYYYSAGADLGILYMLFDRRVDGIFIRAGAGMMVTGNNYSTIIYPELYGLLTVGYQLVTDFGFVLHFGIGLQFYTSSGHGLSFINLPQLKLDVLKIGFAL